MKSVGRVTLIAAVLSGLSCSGGRGGDSTPTSPTPVAVASLTVSPPAATIVVEGTQQLSASTLDARNNVLTGRAVTWSTSDASKATVSTSGLVTGVAVGAATITAMCEGKSSNALITILIQPVASVVVTPQGGGLVVGYTRQLNATMLSAAGSVLLGRSVTWSSSDVAKATVSVSGLVTALAEGSVTITATSEGRSGASTIAITLVAQFAQQGPKIVGSGPGAECQQGHSVALSFDGNTAIVGGSCFPLGSSESAARVWTRTNGAWAQQGGPLVGNDAIGPAIQGISVAISADGNTAVVGGYRDNSYTGAAWVWIRSGGVWTQQGSKLVGSGAVGTAAQGSAVAISADGNTLILGGQGDDSGAGAAWVWARASGVWTQQGPKLVGTGSNANSFRGTSVALSADGNTALVGGMNAQSGVWVWTRNGGIWAQQGPKLIGSGGETHQGWSVALSADGNTAIVGGLSSNTPGQAWVWTRSGGTWTQQGDKLVGDGAVGLALQGRSVSLSSDGNTAIVGGDQDAGAIGAAWIWTRHGSTWTQLGAKLVGAGAIGSSMQGFSVALSGDGNTALIGGDNDDGQHGAAWVFVRPVYGSVGSTSLIDSTPTRSASTRRP